MTKLAPGEFFAQLAPVAIRVRLEGSPMFPSCRLAQNWLETGGVIHPWFNLGGIKVGSGQPNEWWDGSSVKKGTWEVVNGQRIDTSAHFRAYPSVYHFYKDQDVLFQLPRYERVRRAQTPEEQADMLLACGYATDPQYAVKLKNIIKQYSLKQYDREVEQVLKDLQEKVAALEQTVKVLEDQNRHIPAPPWFVVEFGDPTAGGLIRDVDGLKHPAAWEAIAIALRAMGRGRRNDQ